jgi:hypothetical protein
LGFRADIGIIPFVPRRRALVGGRIINFRVQSAHAGSSIRGLSAGKHA